jgi:hypothetical protein
MATDMASKLFIKMFACFAVAWLTVSPSAAETEKPAGQQEQQRDSNDFTTDEDVAFALRFQQAIREGDRKWIVERTRNGFGFFTHGKWKSIKTRADMLRRFDEIYPPAARESIAAANLKPFRDYRDLLFLNATGTGGPLITVIVSCYPQPYPCETENYLFNSITY